MSVSLYSMATKNVKKRNWAFVLYPESAPQDWVDQLKQSGLKCAVSPLHDRDTNPTGEAKKAHYHVIVCYDGPTTYNNVKGLTDRLNQPIPQPLEQVKGYYRYLTHQDNPEKAQYSSADIQTLNGFDIREYVELSRSDVIRLMKEVQQLIRDNGLTEYGQLMNILLDGGEATADMYEVASSHTLFYRAYLTSCWRMAMGQNAYAARDLDGHKDSVKIPGEVDQDVHQ